MCVVDEGAGGDIHIATDFVGSVPILEPSNNTPVTHYSVWGGG